MLLTASGSWKFFCFTQNKGEVKKRQSWHQSKRRCSGALVFSKPQKCCRHTLVKRDVWAWELWTSWHPHKETGADRMKRDQDDIDRLVSSFNSGLLTNSFGIPDDCDVSEKLSLLRGEKLNYNSCTNLLLRKSQNLVFLAPEVQWASKFTVFVRFTFPLNFSNHAHIWYVTWPQ